MSDGRNYASWQPEAVINSRIQQQENIQSNWQYRQFLQKKRTSNYEIQFNGSLL